MTSSEKQTFWKQHIEGWRSSGLSQKAYCESHCISVSNFGYWRKRFAKPGKLIPVTVARPRGVVNIHLPSGVRIELPAESLVEVIPLIDRMR